MTPYLQFHLLGEFRLLVNDQPLDTLSKPRQQALLAYLLLHSHTPQSYPTVETEGNPLFVVEMMRAAFFTDPENEHLIESYNLHESAFGSVKLDISHGRCVHQ